MLLYLPHVIFYSREKMHVQDFQKKLQTLSINFWLLYKYFLCFLFIFSVSITIIYLFIQS